MSIRPPSEALKSGLPLAVYATMRSTLLISFVLDHKKIIPERGRK
jgi:hypothetical protein